ncbi:MAG: DinB family protein [Melioribacteraceae bacterium]
MTRSEKLSNEIYRSIFGDPWHGASAKEILAGISAEEAYQRAASSIHNIIELTLHLTAWTEETLSRFDGNFPSEPKMGDWPAPGIISEVYWESVKQSLFEATDKLISAVNKLPEDHLDVMPGAERIRELGTGFTLEELIYGLVQHNAYHMGQVSLIKKQLTSGNKKGH